MNNGTCPKCGNVVLKLDGVAVDIKSPAGIWKGATFSCQSCGAVLGAGIDPVALKDAIVEEVSQSLRKPR